MVGAPHKGLARAPGLKIVHVEADERSMDSKVEYWLHPDKLRGRILALLTFNNFLLTTISQRKYTTIIKAPRSSYSVLSTGAYMLAAIQSLQKISQAHQRLGHTTSMLAKSGQFACPGGDWYLGPGSVPTNVAILQNLFAICFRRSLWEARLQFVLNERCALGRPPYRQIADNCATFYFDRV